jgi:hypothetical protein
MKDRLTGFLLWVAAGCSLLLLLYVLTSPLILRNVTTPGVSPSPLMHELSGPVIHVLESDFKGPLLWYFGVWGISVEYFACEPVPAPPWYVGPANVSIALASMASLGYPVHRLRQKRTCKSC